MKKLLNILLITSLLFIAASCSKKLDVLPQNYATADLIKSSSDVEALIFGGYTQLQDYGAFGQEFLMVPDLLASDSQLVWVGTYSQYKDIRNKKIVSSNSVVTHIWGNGYNAINIANTVLDKISVVDSSKKDLLEGEARFIRATIYFELVGLFGKPYADGNAATNLGVPLVLLPTYAYDAVKNKPARATVKTIYNLVIADLLIAINKLPEKNTDSRATSYSAKAILSRVYLNMGDYTNAALKANAIIDSAKFSLASTYDVAFNNNSNSPEDIFAVQQSTQSNAGGNSLATFYAPQALGRGDAQIDNNFKSIFGSNDFRASFITAGYSISGANGNYTNKWALFYKAIPVARLAEMYLTRGEANLAAGTQVGALPLDDINFVRARSGAAALNSITQIDFAAERFRELAFEGDRYWTKKRLQLTIDGLGFDDDKLILPIPQREMDANTNLIQNTGY